MLSKYNNFSETAIEAQTPNNHGSHFAALYCGDTSLLGEWHSTLVTTDVVLNWSVI